MDIYSIELPGFQIFIGQMTAQWTRPTIGEEWNAQYTEQNNNIEKQTNKEARKQATRPCTEIVKYLTYENFPASHKHPLSTWTFCTVTPKHNLHLRFLIFYTLKNMYPLYLLKYEPQLNLILYINHLKTTQCTGFLVQATTLFSIRSYVPKDRPSHSTRYRGERKR